MSRVLIFTAVPLAKLQLASSIDGLSGLTDEYPISCASIPGGPSAEWDEANGYEGQWRAAFQWFIPVVAQAMLMDGLAQGTENWFVGFYEGTDTVVPDGSNVIPPPAEATLDAFLSAVGLALPESNGPFG